MAPRMMGARIGGRPCARPTARGSGAPIDAAIAAPIDAAIDARTARVVLQRHDPHTIRTRSAHDPRHGRPAMTDRETNDRTTGTTNDNTAEGTAERVGRAGLAVAPAIDRVVARAAEGTGVSVDAFWSGLAATLADLGPRNAELLAVRAEMQGEDRRLARRAAGPALRDRRLHRFPARDRLHRARGRGLHDRNRERGPRDRAHRGAAARRAGRQCALRAQRRQCALGLALRRALRHRRDGRRARTVPSGL